MRKFMIWLGVGVSAVAGSLPAEAQEVPFNGLRAGVIGGLDIVRPGSTEDSDVDGDDQSVEGLLYGIDAGFDVNLGGAVLGVEAEYSDSTGKTRAKRRDPNLFGYGEVAPGRDLYVGARAGVLASPTTLVYVKGGYTNARLNVVASDGTIDRDDRFRLDGWRIGAGVEKTIGQNTYAKLEYRYSNYTDADFRLSGGATSDTFEVDTDRHQIAAGVGVRFRSADRRSKGRFRLCELLPSSRCSHPC